MRCSGTWPSSRPCPGSPLYTGNRVTPLQDGPDAFAATFAAIHHAQHYLYLEYYILQDVEFNERAPGRPADRASSRKAFRSA